MRTNDKLKELENYLSELSGIIPGDFHEYKHDLKTKAACERYFEKIMAVIVDLCFIIIKEKRFKIPEEDKEAFDILAEEEVISGELAEKFKEAKGMRNIIAHEYGELDDKLVFDSITEDMERDAKEFIRNIKKFTKIR